jgi:hypothetical protein
MAQTGTDPSAGSPAGSVYELPVDRGRQDAAPRGGDGGGSATAGLPDEGSLYRSENNFGTSSQVPGDSRGGGAGAGTTSEAPALKTASAADVGEPSEAGGIALVVLLAAGGIGIGLLSRRSWS